MGKPPLPARLQAAVQSWFVGVLDPRLSPHWSSRGSGWWVCVNLSYASEQGSEVAGFALCYRGD